MGTGEPEEGGEVVRERSCGEGEVVWCSVVWGGEGEVGGRVIYR